MVSSTRKFGSFDPFEFDLDISYDKAMINPQLPAGRVVTLLTELLHFVI